jgi:hypothetical protein
MNFLVQEAGLPITNDHLAYLTVSLPKLKNYL